MVKTSKVKSVQASGTWDSPHGIMYKYEYTMEDGTTLKAQHKGQSPFNQGDEVDYEIKGSNDYGNYGKVSKPSQNSSGGGFTKDNKTQDAILYQVALKGVMDYYTSRTPSVMDNNEYFTEENINELALKIAKGAKKNIEQL